MRQIPLAADRTLLKLSSMVPATEFNEARAGYWQANHELTLRTLQEDFDLAEGIQKGMNSGANSHINFGRFEGALDVFNKTVDSRIAQVS